VPSYSCRCWALVAPAPGRCHLCAARGRGQVCWAAAPQRHWALRPPNSGCTTTKHFRVRTPRRALARIALPPPRPACPFLPPRRAVMTCGSELVVSVHGVHCHCERHFVLRRVVSEREAAVSPAPVPSVSKCTGGWGRPLLSAGVICARYEEEDSFFWAAAAALRGR